MTFVRGVFAFLFIFTSIRYYFCMKLSSKFDLNAQGLYRDSNNSLLKAFFEMTSPDKTLWDFVGQSPLTSDDESHIAKIGQLTRNKLEATDCDYNESPMSLEVNEVYISDENLIMTVLKILKDEANGILDAIAETFLFDEELSSNEESVFMYRK